MPEQPRSERRTQNRVIVMFADPAAADRFQQTLKMVHQIYLANY